MTDEKMIEEIAKAIEGTYDIATKYYPDKYEPVEFRVYPDDIARELFNAKCRILPENAVVLTREEYEKTIQEKLKLGMEMGERQVSKKMVKEIIYKVREILKKAPTVIDYDGYGIDCYDYGYAKQSVDFEIDKLAKQYGVEVEEL